MIYIHVSILFFIFFCFYLNFFQLQFIFLYVHEFKSERVCVMNYLGKNIRYLRKKKNMSQEDIAELFGYSNYTTVQKWETSKADPPIKIAKGISEYFGVNLDDLINSDLKESGIVISKKSPKITKIPIYGSIAAGIPISANTDIVGYVYDTEGLFDPDTHFCLEIKGDSMTPDFHEGDKVIVHSQPDAETGEVVAVMIDGCEATCKRLKKYEDSIALVSNNPLYEPMIFTAEEIASLPVQIMGKVVELRRKY